MNEATLHWLSIIEANCLDNKYTRWYIKIMLSSICRDNISDYFETHHILPKCFNLGGETDKSNLVKLTGKEHFIAHLLLSKMTNDKILNIKLNCALLRMAFTNGVNRHKVSSRMYNYIRRSLSSSKKGVTGTPWTLEQKLKLKGRTPPNKGVPMSDNQKEKLRNVRKLQVMKPRSEETKEKLRAHFTGKKRSREMVEKMIKDGKFGKSAGFLWWTNGETETRSPICPGINWKNGRLRKGLKCV